MMITMIMMMMALLLWLGQVPWVTEGYSLLVRDNKRYRCRSPPVVAFLGQCRRRRRRFYAAVDVIGAAASTQDVLMVLDTSSSSVAATAPAATAAATKVNEDEDSPPSSNTTTTTILVDKKDELLRLLLLVSGRRRRGGPVVVVHGRDRDVNQEERPTQPHQHQQPPTVPSAVEYWQSVASCINEMENLYDTPPQTVDFFHFATSGTWTHVLCTHRRPPPQVPSSGVPKLRVKEVQQRVVDANGRNSTIHNVIEWELLHESDEKVTVTVDHDISCPPSPTGTATICSGTFTVVCEAHMSPTTGSSRQHWTVVDRTLELDTGSELPRNVPRLVQLLGRHVPSTTLWDPDNLASDTTYLDADLRIVRYTGVAGREGVRDVFVRQSILAQYKEHERECDD